MRELLIFFCFLMSNSKYIILLEYWHTVKFSPDWMAQKQLWELGADILYTYIYGNTEKVYIYYRRLTYE